MEIFNFVSFLLREMLHVSTNECSSFRLDTSNVSKVARHTFRFHVRNAVYISIRTCTFLAFLAISNAENDKLTRLNCNDKPGKKIPH